MMEGGALTRRQRHPEVPAASAAGLAIASAPLMWWAIGPLGEEWPDHSFGLYHVSAGLLYALGGISVAVAAAAVLFAVAPRLHREAGAVSLWTALLLIVPGMLAASAWRVATAGVVSANIGGGLALLIVPVLVSATLVGAVLVERAHRQQRLKHGGVLVAMAVFIAPALYAVEVFVR